MNVRKGYVKKDGTKHIIFMLAGYKIFKRFTASRDPSEL